jgi:hypothetical protein
MSSRKESKCISKSIPTKWQSSKISWSALSRLPKTKRFSLTFSSGWTLGYWPVEWMFSSQSLMARKSASSRARPSKEIWMSLESN